MEFARYVESFQTLYLAAKSSQAPVLLPLKDLIAFIPHKILILAPHPDDECLMGGFALRSQEELGAKVLVVPFSFGSKKDRRAERKSELNEALKILNFELLDPRSMGSDEELTENQLLDAVLKASPDVVITTHLKDGHPVHIRSAEMTKRALVAYAKKTNQAVTLLQTEFWQSMENPNLLIPLSAKHLATLGNALMEHRGEVSRNPYHLTLPAWSMDQVRRGSEMLKTPDGKSKTGSISSAAVFAQILRSETIK